MKVALAILASTTVLLLACSKDKFTTKPRLEIKSYNSKEIHNGQTLTMRINFFDKEGDIGTGDFWLARYRTNIKQLDGSDVDRADTLDAARGYHVPDFPPSDKGEIFVDLTYADFLKESNDQNDTIYFRIAVKDKAGNASDTITSDQLVIVL